MSRRRCHVVSICSEPSLLVTRDASELVGVAPFRPEALPRHLEREALLGCEQSAARVVSQLRRRGSVIADCLDEVRVGPHTHATAAT